MLGKYFIFAVVVCISFVQVRGDGLADDIAKALKKVEEAAKAVDNEIRNFRLVSERINNTMQDRISEFSDKAIQDSKDIGQALTKTAEIMENKAKESGKPESALECIDRFLEEGLTYSASLAVDFHQKLTEMEGLTREEMEILTIPMTDMNETLSDAYSDALDAIEECESVENIQQTVFEFEKWVAATKEEISWIIREVTAVFSDFEKQAYDGYSRTKNQQTRLKFLYNGNIRTCVLNRDAIFE